MMESVTYAFPLTDPEPNWVYGRAQLVVTVRGSEVEFAPHARPFASGERNENYPYVAWKVDDSDLAAVLAYLSVEETFAKSFIDDSLRVFDAPEWVLRGVAGESGWWRHAPGFDPEMDGKPWGAAMAKLAAMIDWDATDRDGGDQLLLDRGST